MGCFAIGSRRTACTDALEDGKRQRRLPCFGSHRSQSVTGEIRADSQTALRPRQRHGESQPPVARLEHRTGLTDSQPYFPRAETAQIRRLCLRILAEGRDSGIQDRSLHADHLSIELTTKSSFVPSLQEKHRWTGTHKARRHTPAEDFSDSIFCSQTILHAHVREIPRVRRKGCV